MVLPGFEDTDWVLLNRCPPTEPVDRQPDRRRIREGDGALGLLRALVRRGLAADAARVAAMLVLELDAEAPTSRRSPQ
jgi:hypothetical protein